MSLPPEYTIVNAFKGGSSKDTIFNSLNTEVNKKIKEGYTPLGSPGIIKQGMDEYVYQALIIKPPASASPGSSQQTNIGGSKSRSRKSYKKYTKKSSSRRHKNRK